MNYKETLIDKINDFEIREEFFQIDCKNLLAELIEISFKFYPHKNTDLILEPAEPKIEELKKEKVEFNIIPFGEIFSETYNNDLKPIIVTNIEPTKVKTEVFEEHTPIKYNNEKFLYYRDLDAHVLFADLSKIEKVDWIEEIKNALKNNELEFTETELEELLNCSFSFDFNKTTIMKELHGCVSLKLMTDYIQAAYRVYLNPPNKITLTPHQEEVSTNLLKKIKEIMSIKTNQVNATVTAPAQYLAVYDGAAGTGKTTTMAEILKTLVKDDYTLCFCSPTHQALGVIRETLNLSELAYTEDPTEFIMGGYNIIIKTLASFLGIKIKRDMETGVESFTTDPNANTFSVDILCIDESSMVSRDQITLLLKRLRVDFKMILFVGDEPQLPSPSDGNETNGVFNLPYKFSLTEVVRQAADSKILQLAWVIREKILSFNTFLKPSFIITEEYHNGNDIILFRDQAQFMNYYFNDEVISKVISTYTNKITNEYNSYVRNMIISNQSNIKLDIVCNYESYLDKNKEDARNYIESWDDYKEYFPGEKIILSEVNQINGSVLHQNGEIVTIHSATEKTYSIQIMIPAEDLMGSAEFKEFTIEYFEIIDTNFKKINVIKNTNLSLFSEMLILLRNETEHRTGKDKWKKYWSFKERFTKVNHIYAATLYKMQGSTYQNVYVDLRDLDRFHQWNPVITYKLLYVALTRPKGKIIILI